MSHNTVFGNRGGIAIAQPGATLVNNIIYGNTEFGVLAHRNGSGSVEYNLLGAGTEIQEEAAGMLSQGHNRVGDPKFVSPGADFHLQAGSAAIAVGASPPWRRC